MEERFATIHQKKIVVAMSGGVDSSVTAALLQRQGAQVQGVFMAMAQPDLEEQVRRVRAVADFLKVPLTVLDLADAFRRSVVDYFCASYFAGKTPNPCMVCNRTIKFGLLLDQARATLGADLFATGHYARISGDNTTGYRLHKGVDPKKDQSYFLGLLTQAQLARICFPLGGFRKAEVYGMAAEFGLAFGDTAESQDICFLKNQTVGGFLASHFPGNERPGPMLTLQGKEMGRHAGIHHYTIGQRRGLGLPDATPWYVVGLERERDAVLIGKDADLWQQEVLLPEVHWLSGQAPTLPFVCMVKIRSRHSACQAEIVRHEGDGVRLIFAQPQRAVTPGQFAVFYEDEVVIGCGEIAKCL
ncbi:MAG TPA: tRNA 2-thiouridine(34) synthase MnmA [Desulfobulbaceae bacterium]|nr:tRNA 2-thiouridine(34) synthase MnmA [Desulfobulbaceae bacterium]